MGWRDVKAVGSGMGAALVGLLLMPWLPVALAEPPPAAAPRFQTVGAEAIPRAVVAAAVQDSVGFLWVATGDGLVRFDGYRFSPQTLHGLPAAEGNPGWVLALLPDRDGRLWIGTETKGLALYDPDSDRIHVPRSPPTHTSDHPVITSLARSSDGTVWAGLMGGGLEEQAPGGLSARRHRAGQGPGRLPDDRVLALLVDDSGGLWVGTWQGLVRRQPGSTDFEPVAAGPGRSLQGRAVQRLFQASDGQIWAGTRQGDLVRIDPGSGLVQWLRPPGETATAGAVTAFVEPPGPGPRQVWVARSTGIDLHRASDGLAVRALRHNPRDAAGLGAAHVTTLLLDRAGWVWVGSLGGGLQRHNPQPSALVMRGGEDDPRSPLHNPSAHSVLVLPPPALSLARPPVRSPAPTAVSSPAAARHGLLAAAEAEEVWIGTQDAGVAVLDGRGRLRGNLRPPLLPSLSVSAVNDAPPDGLPAAGAALERPSRLLVQQPAADTLLPRVEALALAPDGSVWMSAGGWLQQFDRQRRVLRQLWHGAGDTHQMRVGRDGSLWVGTRAGLLRWRQGQATVQWLQPERSDEGRAPLVGAVYALTEAADDSLWVGSQHGLWRVPAGADRLQPVPAEADAGLGSQVVIGLLVDREQQLWLDTAVTGLHRMTHWDGRQARFDAISRRLGVVGKPFGANLLQDGRGRIWSQLHVYDPASDRLDELTATDGQALGTGWFWAYAQRADGRMLFGGSRGLLQVQPEAFSPASDRPPLVVTQLRINGKREPAAGLGPAQLAQARERSPAANEPASARSAGLVLRPGQRSFSLELAALEFGEPARLRYAWRLQGFDANWTETAADQRQPTYANLAPGSYLLRVRSSNRSGVWSDQELAIPVQVLPAWWQHSATRVLFGVALLGLALAAMHWRTNALRRRQQVLARTVTERTLQLQDLTQALQRESAALKEASLTDPLTGLRNRRFLTEHIEADVAASLRRWQDHQREAARANDGQPLDAAPPAAADLLFFLFDIDHFKRVNDLHGHPAGDAVVRQMRGRLQRVFRDSDHMVRWGGEEFLIVARGSARAHAADLAERARQAVASEPFALPEGEGLHCTCSLGFACFPLSTRHPAAVSWSTIVGLADAALYRAKNQGRNAWAGVLDAPDLDETALALPRTGAQWLVEGSLRQQCSWQPPASG